MSKKFVIVFDFKTYYDDHAEDIIKELDFIPIKGMNIYFDDDDILLPENMENRGWFKVIDADYMLKENIFIVSLMALESFEQEE